MNNEPITDERVRGLQNRDVQGLSFARSLGARNTTDSERSCADRIAIFDELLRLRSEAAQRRLSDDEREVLLRSADRCDQFAGFYSSIKYGDEPEAAPYRADAAILRRLASPPSQEGSQS